MNFKKLGSIILAVAMILSLMSFTAFAGAGAYYELSYENITNPGGDIKADDLFWAIVTLKDATTLAGGQIDLNFDTSVVQLAKATGEVATAFVHTSNGTVDGSSRVTSKVKVENEEGEMVSLFAQRAGTIDTVNGNVNMSYSSDITIDGSYINYDLTTDEQTNGLLIMKIRFKALAAGDAGFTYGEGIFGMQYLALFNDTIHEPMTGITPLAITAEDQEQTAPEASLFTVTKPSELGAEDGIISGTTTEMEYRLSTDVDYTDCEGTSITGLAAGTYYIRYAAKTGFFASDDTQVIVEDGNAPISGVAARLPALVDIDAGTEVQVPVTFTDLPAGTKSFDFGLTYDDSVLTYKSVITTDGYVEDTRVDDETVGKLGVAGLTTEGGVGGESVVITTLVFTVLADAETQTTNLTLSHAKYGDTDATNTEILSGNLVNGTIGVVEVSDPVALAKANALIELDTYYTNIDQTEYSIDGKAALQAAYDDGVDAIEAAIDVEGVNAALEDAKDAIDAVKNLAAELADAKVAAKANLEAYYNGFNKDDYSAAGKSALLSAKNAGDTAIGAATDVAGVAAALAAAKTALDEVDTLADELEDAKEAAKTDLQNYYDAIDLDEYSEVGKAALLSAKNAGDAAIDAATDVAGVAAALAAAKTALDEVDTLADELEDAKEAAKTDLQNYYDAIDLDEYSEGGKAALLAAKNAGDAAIDAATDVAGVNAALVAAKTAIDAVKNLAGELADAKVAAKANLQSYYDAIDLDEYSEAGKTALASAKTTGDTAIDAAADVAGVDAALQAAKDALDGVDNLDEEKETAIAALNDKIDKEEEITYEDIVATGAVGLNSENFSAYRVALIAARTVTGTNLVIADINAAIVIANAFDADNRGDVISGGDEDGIYANDASAVKQYILGNRTLTAEQALRADENGDGSVDVLDVGNILVEAAANNVPK